MVTAITTSTVASVEFLGVFEKTPIEVLVHNFFFGDWLKRRDDTIDTYTVVAENYPAENTQPVALVISSLTLVPSPRTGLLGTIGFFMSGGAPHDRYKVTATINTVGGLVKQASILVRVKIL